MLSIIAAVPVPAPAFRSLKTWRRVARCGVIAAFGLAMTVTSPVNAQITDVSPENKAVNTAIEKAQKELPVFLERLANPRRGDSGFLVKLRYEKSTANGGGEHIWAKDVVRDGGTISATIDNEPREIDYLKLGQRVVVTLSQITDWLYVRDEKYRGAYTVRALLPFMEKAQAAEMRKKLGPE